MLYLIFYLDGKKGNAHLIGGEENMLLEVGELLTKKEAVPFLVIREDDPLYMADEAIIEKALRKIRRECPRSEKG